MSVWKMNYKKGCKWEESIPVENLKCVKDKGVDEKTCTECELRKA